MMQNLVILMEPCDDDFKMSENGGKMCLNRFCIDEDATFELSGVHYLKKSSRDLKFNTDLKYFFKRKSKGKGYSLRFQQTLNQTDNFKKFNSLLFISYKSKGSIVFNWSYNSSLRKSTI